MGRVVSRTVRLPEDLDIELKILAARAKLDKSELYELGARVVLAILKSGFVPDGLGYVLQERDSEALERLQQLVKATAARG